MDETLKREKRNKVLQAGAIGVLMFLLMLFIGIPFFGSTGILILLAFLILLLVLTSSHRLSYIPNNSIRLSYYQAPQLFKLVDWLARKAELPQTPHIYITQNSMPNAASMGDKEHSILILTTALIKNLSEPELEGVLAHEISHIRNNDLFLFRLTEIIKEITFFISRFGWFMLFFLLPVVIASENTFPFAFFLFLAVIPIISTILQFALMRNREFTADLEAVRLTDNPKGLASALYKIEHGSMSFIQEILPIPRKQESSIFKTHPSTNERISRLNNLNPDILRMN